MRDRGILNPPTEGLIFVTGQGGFKFSHIVLISVTLGNIHT